MGILVFSDWAITVPQQGRWPQVLTGSFRRGKPKSHPSVDTLYQQQETQSREGGARLRYLMKHATLPWRNTALGKCCKMNNHAIAVCTDGKMLPAACCTLLSASKYSSNADLFMVTYNVNNEENLSIDLFKKKHQIRFQTINLKSGFEEEFLKKHQAAALRLILDELIPEIYDKVLYLDSDILIIKNINDIFKIDLKGKAIAAVKDTINNSSKNSIRFDEMEISISDYFNSGVILFDWSRIIRNKMLKKTRSILNTKNLRYGDQDALNIAFADQWLPLNLQWNCMTPFIGKKTINKNILHFTGGKSKPWQSEATILLAPYRNYMKNSLSNTPWERFIIPITTLGWLRGEYREKINQIRRHGLIKTYIKNMA